MDRDIIESSSDWGEKMIDEGRWDQTRGKIRETWGDITDQDLESSKGNWDQLVGKIKEKTGETTEAIEKKMREWFS